uniref:RagB/SusD family nutrient uptake outer membrane protein n=1 Tax=Pedobacter schmidteae TaxID=2201271 RepID=UPI000EB43B40|nr:RagB/SusD family nutrient uptake outer membrane protein [Pedobacter schmidteae]
MKIFSRILMVLMSFGMSFSACKIDDIKPMNALTDENVISNEATAQSVLNSVYAKSRVFYTAMSGYLIEFLGNGLANLQPAYGSQNMDVNDVRFNDDFVSAYYPEQYQLINQANWLVSLLEQGKAVGLGEQRKNEMIAEARCLRAMAHFNVLRLYGQFYDPNSTYGIVIRTTPGKGLENLPRKTVQQSYDAIVADLEFAAANGPTGVAHRLVSRTTAKAFLAKAYLYMGNYGAAAAQALAVIGNTDGYALENQYADVFKNRFDSKETLFSPFVNGLQEQAGPVYQIRSSSFSADLEQLANAAVAGPGSLSGAGSGYDPRFSYVYAQNSKGINNNGKYPFYVADPGNGSAFGNTIYPLRMAEVYLIYAEAKARLSTGVDADAVLRVNEIRKRAGVVLSPIAPADKKALLLAIYQEKMLELVGENGEHWFDMVRYDRLGDIAAATTKPSISNVNKLIMPIPQTARAGNKELVQNPGYE